MNRNPWQMTVTVMALVVAAGLLTGCPKKPAAGPGATGAGTTAGAGATSGSGPGGAGGGPGSGGVGGASTGTIGSGPGGTLGSGTAGGAGGAGGASGGAGGPGGAGALGPGVAGATGTTIPALPSPKEFTETSALRDVHFDFDKYDIRPQDAPLLEENARWLQTNEAALLLIEGHADERGTNEYNLALGEKRAKAARDFLVSLGVSGARITVISYGEERPVCTERTEACWGQNRRGHFLVKQ